MNTAIVHDGLNGMRGGEKVLEALIELYPDATIFTLFHERDRVSTAIAKCRIVTSWLDRVPAVLDVWYPGAAYGYVNHFTRPLEVSRTDGIFYSFVARLAPGASDAQAQAELDVLVPALADRHPEDNDKFKTVRARLYGGLGPDVLQRRRYRDLVGSLVAITAIACIAGAIAAIVAVRVDVLPEPPVEQVIDVSVKFASVPSTTVFV